MIRIHYSPETGSQMISHSKLFAGWTEVNPVHEQEFNFSSDEGTSWESFSCVYPKRIKGKTYSVLYNYTRNSLILEFDLEDVNFDICEERIEWNKDVVKNRTFTYSINCKENPNTKAFYNRYPLPEDADRSIYSYGDLTHEQHEQLGVEYFVGMP